MLTLSPARQKFWQIAHTPDQDMSIDHLLEGALAIAWEEYPRMDLGYYREIFDRMVDDLQPRIAKMHYPLKVVQEINQYLFAEQGFRGNDGDYYDPRNSFITDVLERRLGIPLSLSLVYMVICDRLGFPMDGISFPAHFIIRPRHPDLEIFIDPYNKGEILFPEDCAAKLTQLYGYEIPLQPEYLEPVSIRRILDRLLTNLKLIYLRRREPDKALAAIERSLMLNPDVPTQWRDRGLICYQLDRFTEARIDLENYLQSVPYAEDGRVILQLIEEIKPKTL
ncbi:MULTISPECIES: SirB1 family protein [Pseudanabaena]|uniref:SirB1 family protein n=1 Tax=Pseudanabaena TaxID=1152 RepID=UPI00247AC79B|nr:MULTISPECIES: tetratricopeptide repeat protein [Pseudanabaena]MEA5487713.1 tetratricopeptide repeat protein [Pseudanabaena sp. CCNP1317]WGS70818.1 tetratricopeptide repeat protein [Pseudanabaena galeata CCNP1313]